MRDEDNLTEQQLRDLNDPRQHPQQPSDDLPLTETDEYPRLLQAILAHTSEGAVLVQPSTGRILYTTVSLDRKFGYEPNELIGQHVTVLNAPDTSKGTHDRIVEEMEEKGAWQGEINNKKKDGSCFWTWIDIFTFEHATYGPVWVSVRRDVTDERRTQELRKFVRKLRGDFNDLVETLPHGIQLTDASWTITFANSALHEMYEYDAGELIGASILDFVPSGRRQEKVERLKTLVTQKPKPVPIFEQKVTRSGRVLDVRMDWGYRLDAKGRVLGFAFLITDVTASMRVEAALRKTQEAFDLAVRGSSDGLWDWPDLTQDKRWWSPRIFELLGYEDGEIELTYAEFLGLMLSEDRERVTRAMEAHLKEGVPYDVEHRLRTKSGEYRWSRGRGHHDWSTNSGDLVNPANRPDLLWANTPFRTEAQLRMDGSTDLRFQTKFKDVPPYQLLEVQSDLQYTLYEDPGAPFVWVKNEELILLRAEANLALGDLDQALVDINFIRENSGGLEPLASPGTAADLLDELLYNKRFSLVFEWGHTWIDMNHYGKLLEMPVLGLPSADVRLHDAMPYPLSECLPREPDVPAGCTTQQGFLP